MFVAGDIVVFFCPGLLCEAEGREDNRTELPCLITLGAMRCNIEFSRLSYFFVEDQSHVN
jgi:hypothetical protein